MPPDVIEVIREPTPVIEVIQAVGPMGPTGPAGPQGEPGSLTGPAGGDLSGTYPDPTVVKSAGDFNVGGKLEVVGVAGSPGMFITGTPSPVIRSNTAGVIWNNRLAAADAQPSFKVTGNGRIDWGAGGATAQDTNLYRSAANELKTDDGFAVGSYLSFPTAVAAASVPNNSIFRDSADNVLKQKDNTGVVTPL